MSSGWLWGTGGEGFGGGRRPDPEFREQAGVSAIVQAGVLTDPQACVMMESNSNYRTPYGGYRRDDKT